MTRAIETISAGLLLSSLYLAAFLGLIPFPAKIQEEIIPVVWRHPSSLQLRRAEQNMLTGWMVQLPFWALVSFGAYLLFSLGLGIFTFNDREDAYHELVKEIDQAKKELRVKGVDVD